MRCKKCEACFYCDQTCAKRGWKVHKKVCTADPALKEQVPIEDAVEKVVAQLKEAEAPKGTRCFICLEDEEDGVLLRGCACRGEGAGYVHVDCLARFAETRAKEAKRGIWLDNDKTWYQCVTCQRILEGKLGLEMCRRLWRRAVPIRKEFPSNYAMACTVLSGALTQRSDDPFVKEAALSLVQESKNFGRECATMSMSRGARNEMTIIDIVTRAAPLVLTQPQNAIDMLTPVMTAARQLESPHQRALALNTMVFAYHGVGRYDDVIAIAEDAIAIDTQIYGPDEGTTLNIMDKYGEALYRTGHDLETGHLIAKKLHAAYSRIYGSHHPATKRAAENLKGFKQQRRRR